MHSARLLTVSGRGLLSSAIQGMLSEGGATNGGTLW